MDGADRLPGVRWGVDVALARRGDEAALQRVFDAVRQGFPLTAAEQEYSRKADIPYGFYPPAHFEVIVDMAPLAPADAVPICLKLIEDHDPKMLAERAAAVLAIGAVWDELDADTQQDVRRRIGGFGHRLVEDPFVERLIQQTLTEHR